MEFVLLNLAIKSELMRITHQSVFYIDQTIDHKSFQNI